MNYIIAKGLLIPFLGTALGSALVFFMKKELNARIQKILSGFAAGVMVAASVWSLLIPSMEMTSDRGRLAFIPAAVGFCLGMIFLLILDKTVPHMHLDETQEGVKSKLQKTTMMVLAVTLHNIPEGMAVGILYAGWASGVMPVLPYFLSFAAGAMIYVVVEELVPEMSEGEHSDWGTIAFMLGFALMMILDVALG